MARQGKIIFYLLNAFLCIRAETFFFFFFWAEMHVQAQVSDSPLTGTPGWRVDVQWRMDIAQREASASTPPS